MTENLDEKSEYELMVEEDFKKRSESAENISMLYPEWSDRQRFAVLFALKRIDWIDIKDAEKELGRKTFLTNDGWQVRIPAGSFLFSSCPTFPVWVPLDHAVTLLAHQKPHWINRPAACTTYEALPKPDFPAEDYMSTQEAYILICKRLGKIEQFLIKEATP